jgi:RNA-directed DNA polymerase
MSEIPVHFRPRRLSDWINPTGAKKVHSLIDKVYKQKNLEMAWEKVCQQGQWRNRWAESGGIF